MHQFKREQRVRLIRGRLVREVYAVTRHTSKPYAVFREWLDGHRESRNLYYRNVAGWLFAAPGDEDSWGSYEVERWSDFAPKDDFCWDGPSAEDVELLKSYRPSFRWCIDKAQGYNVAEIFQLLRAFDEDPAVEHLVEAGLKGLALSSGFRRLSRPLQRAVAKWSAENGDHGLRAALDCLREGIAFAEWRRWQMSGEGRLLPYKVYRHLYAHGIPVFEYREYIRTLAAAGKDARDPYWGLPTDFRRRRRSAERIVANLRKAQQAAEREARRAALEKVAARFASGLFEGQRVWVPGSFEEVEKQAEALDQCLVSMDYASRVAKGSCVLVFIADDDGTPIATAELLPNGKGWKVGQFYGDERKDDYLAGKGEKAALKAWAKVNRIKLKFGRAA